MTPARTPYPEPAQTDDLRGVMLDYLDFYRGVVAGKLDGLSTDDAQPARSCRRGGRRRGWSTTW